jgi:hypothetical protein
MIKLVGNISYFVYTPRNIEETNVMIIKMKVIHATDLINSIFKS